MFVYKRKAGSWFRRLRNLLPGTGDLAPWSDSNHPCAYTSTADFTDNWPACTIVPIQTGSADFYTNLVNTVNAAGGRVVVQLGAGVYHLNQFRMAGSSGDPLYSFGFYIPNLQGLLGQGYDKTFVQMDAGSINQTQLDAMAQMTQASFNALNMGFCRFDGTAASPILVGGLTFQAADQPMLTAKASDVSIFVPQPAPHQGVVFYNTANYIVSHVRFRAAGRGAYSQPPFECANFSVQRGTGIFYHCEFDSRRAPELDPARPRRCGVIMGNNETSMEFQDCWFHHSNVSRYAVNDQNSNTSGVYTLTRCRLEQITNTQNTDPALNGGASLGGYTNATPLGWESCNGTIYINDCTIIQDNPFTNGQIAQHIQLTSVGTRNPQGGRMYIKGGIFKNNGFPILDGYLCARIINTTYWYLDGLNVTISAKDSLGNSKTAHVYPSGNAWPPTQAYLDSNNLSPSTHYIVRTS